MSNNYQHKGKENFLKAFEKFQGSGNGTVSGIRKDAIARFGELGFPSTRHEEWKYTNISPILGNSFQLSTPGNFRLNAEDVRALSLCGKDVYLMVFENGRFNSALSNLPENKDGIITGSLAEHIAHPAVSKHLAKHAAYGNESFVALNTAFVNDGAFVYLPEGKVLDRPVYIMYISDTREQATVVYPRNLIIAEKNAGMTLANSFHSMSDVHQGFTNVVTEVVVGDNALVEWDTIQTEGKNDYHINYTEAILARDARFNTCTVTLSGNIVRNNLHIVMNDVNACSHLWGLYIVDGESLVDNHTMVDHAKPNCYSNELYKGILDDKAQGVFNGKVMVREDAQKTNAYQSNKNILLSDDASMNAKPQLEIFADDVKCSHGATTGQLDEEALFYLRSRGIGEKKAKAFLNIAFAADVIKNISVESVKDRLLQVIEQKLSKINNA